MGIISKVDELGWFFIQRTRAHGMEGLELGAQVPCCGVSTQIALLWGWKWGWYCWNVFSSGHVPHWPDLVWSFSLCSLPISSSGVSWSGLGFVCRASLLSVWLLDPTIRGKHYSWTHTWVGTLGGSALPWRAPYSEGWALSFFSSIGDGHATSSPFLNCIPLWSPLWRMSGSCLGCVQESVIMTGVFCA